MGQKVYPTGFRLGITENWRSRWFADKNYAETLGNDLEIRKFLAKRLSRAALSRVEIERAGDKVKVIILTARPGIVIGKKGAEIDNLRTELERVAGVEKGQLSVDVIEVKRPELDANPVSYTHLSATSSSTPSSAASCPRSTSRPSIRASRRP